MTTPPEDGQTVEPEGTATLQAEGGQEEETEVIDIGSLDRPYAAGPDLDVQRHQEKIRGWLAIILTSIFGSLVLLPLVFWVLFVDLKGLDINGWIEMALPAVTGLLGSAMGFYFGTRST